VLPWLDLTHTLWQSFDKTNNFFNNNKTFTIKNSPEGLFWKAQACIAQAPLTL
jgi:hypothetical protein